MQLFVQSFHPVASNICQRFWWFLFWAGISHWPWSKSCFAGCTFMMIVGFGGHCFSCDKDSHLNVRKSSEHNLFPQRFITRSYFGLEGSRFAYPISWTWLIAVRVDPRVFNKRIRCPESCLRWWDWPFRGVPMKADDPSESRRSWGTKADDLLSQSGRSFG